MHLNGAGESGVALKRGASVVFAESLLKCGWHFRVPSGINPL